VKSIPEEMEIFRLFLEIFTYENCYKHHSGTIWDVHYSSVGGPEAVEIMYILFPEDQWNAEFEGTN
jgi:hypothetical protein